MPYFLAAWLAMLCAAACVATPDDTGDDLDRRRKDARTADTTRIDAAPPPTSTGAGTVSCYTEGVPTASCAPPDHCCFSNYSAQHNGYCTTSTCAYGTITCDGPEDCAAGDRCCAHAITDPYDGTVGYTLACQSTACGAPPLDQQLCHPATGCGDGRSCVTAYGNDNDLPRTLYICQ